MLPVVGSSIPGVLRERASLNPNGAAITYIDYDKTWDGVEETLTWSQLYRRMLNVAEQLKLHGSTGDRAVILAPQDLNTSLDFWVRCRPALSQFRFRFRMVVLTTSARFRYLVTLRPPSF